MRCGNTTPAAVPRRRGWRTLALGCLVMAGLWGGPAKAKDQDWSLPEDQQAAIRWDLLSGYWGSPWGNEFVFTRRDGFLYASREADNAIFLSVGRWRPIRRLAPFKRVGAMMLEHVATAGNILRCFAFGHATKLDKYYLMYRSISVDRDDESLLFRWDDEFDFHPPADFMTADVGTMWSEYRQKTPTSTGKEDGPWRHIGEAQLPQWFHELLTLDLIAHPRCRP